MASVHMSFARIILSFAKVDTSLVNRPRVIAEVIKAAGREYVAKTLIFEVGNGANINKTGSKVMIVVAAAAAAFSISERLPSFLLICSVQDFESHRYGAVSPAEVVSFAVVSLSNA